MKLLFVVLRRLMSDFVFKAYKKRSKASSLPPSLHNSIKDGLQKVFEYDLADKIEILSLSKRPNISKNHRV